MAKEMPDACKTACLDESCECNKDLSHAPENVFDQQARAVLHMIRAAQDNGFSERGEDGSVVRTCPGFGIARTELETGAKKSHWIWYVWPSLQSVRSKVRYPQFLLPSLHAATVYLNDPTLAERLVHVSELATAHLKAGVAPQKLFGKQHRYDIPKFREAMTVFAIAARLNRNESQESTFLTGLCALGEVELDKHAVTVLCQSAMSAEAAAATQVAAGFHLLVQGRSQHFQTVRAASENDHPDAQDLAAGSDDSVSLDVDQPGPSHQSQRAPRKGKWRRVASPCISTTITRPIANAVEQ